MKRNELMQRIVDAGFPYSMDTISKLECFQKLLEGEREACAKHLDNEGWTYGAAIIRSKKGN